tara:strand:- start:4351 stop:6867 length:2517 start_codon:yes stop_codon:yes gene_type:complete
LIAFVLLGAIGLVGIVLLSHNVTRDLKLLNSASSDNVQWTLSQAEVEFLEFQMNLGEATSDPAPDLRALRRDFDIFYSRINTLGQASIYANLRGLPDFSRNLRIVQTFLDRSTSAIDASDAELTRTLPDLLDRTNAVRPNVRKLSNSGLNFFAHDSDRRRGSIAVTLTQLAAGVTFLMLVLVFLAAYLARLNTQSDKRRAEAIEAGRRMNIVIDTALDAVIVSDADGRILVFNSAAEQMFGHSAEDAIGSELGQLIVPDHHIAAHEAGMQRLRTGGARNVVGKGRVKLEAKRANGDIFPVEFAIQSATTDEGEIFIAFLRDISLRVRSERELVVARDRALAGEKAKTDFLATMSHEIRTPLNGLLGNLTLLHDTRLSAKQARYIKNMDTSGKLLMSHISDVLDITKYDAGKLRLRPVAMNLSDLLQDIIDNQSGAALAHDTTLEWGWTGPQADWICADRDRIQHILMNVIGNAVKFTRNGRITVNAEVAHDADAGPVLQITVSDTGIGMEADLQTQIFDDFMTGDSSYDRDVGGTGLGLGIAQRFVKALGGTITVESEKGRGSTFAIHLPIEPVAAPTAAHEGRATQAQARPSDILLVEDNEINRVVAREMLLSAGHKVTEAHNGQIAVDMAQAHRFDLILMDISMPVLDGRGATRAIRAGAGASANTPIVALTANAMADEQEAFLSDGMNDILTKPLNRDGLIRVIANHVVSGGAPSAMPEVTVAFAYLDDLRDTLGVDALATLLTRYAAEVAEVIAYLQDHANHSTEEVAQRAHRIAGSSAALGAVDLRAALIAVETAAKSGDTAQMVQAIDRLPDVWAATQPQMTAERRASSRME